MEINSSWKAHAYPLTQVSIRLQGTRHSDIADVIKQLDLVRDRLLKGETSGTAHDDDFGYSFMIEQSADGPSFFDEACGKR